MQGTKIDLLINCRWIIPVVPNNQILENCALAVDAERIVGIYPQAEAAKCFDARKTEQLNDHIVMPGILYELGVG
jgi:5-methylthioadenosine/S-adenosylhomocysteine deaminase